MTTDRYTTIAGEVIDYPTPRAEVAAFIERVKRDAHDPRVTSAQLTELVYGKANPLLDQTIFPGRGAVTKAVLADPTYHVLLDLLDAKRVQLGTLPADPLAAFDMTVSEAAAALEMSTGAVRQAIAAGNLVATKRGGQHLLDRASVATYRAKHARRGPVGVASKPALEVCTGNATGGSLRIKVRGGELEVTKRTGDRAVEGVVRSFETAIVAFGGRGQHRVFLIEPADEENEFTFKDFYIRGRYRVRSKINNPAVASNEFAKFRALGTVAEIDAEIDALMARARLAANSNAKGQDLADEMMLEIARLRDMRQRMAG